MDVPELFSIPPPQPNNQKMFTRHLFFKLFLSVLMTLIASIITFSEKKNFGKTKMLLSTLDKKIDFSVLLRKCLRVVALQIKFHGGNIAASLAIATYLPCSLQKVNLTGQLYTVSSIYKRTPIRQIQRRWGSHFTILEQFWSPNHVRFGDSYHPHIYSVSSLSFFFFYSALITQYTSNS